MSTVDLYIKRLRFLLLLIRKKKKKSKMKVYRINNRNYYKYDEVRKNNPLLMRGCKTKADFIEKHNLPKIAWTHARLNKKVWTKSDGSSCKVDKFFIRKPYYLENMNGDVMTEPLPGPVNMDDDDIFKGPNGELLRMQIVGDRTVDGVYFRVDDVSVVFEMPNLKNNVMRKDRDGYQVNIHYKLFIVHNNTEGIKATVKTELYLTYRGLLRALFTTKSVLAEPYILWATNTLFTIQMGTKKKKTKLISKITGITSATLKELAKTNVTTMPCVYLFSIGTVKNLRRVMGLGDEYIDTDYVYKLGYTNDLSRRAGEHEITYGAIEGSEIKLALHSYVDVRYIAEAESDVKDLCAELNVGIKYENYRELVIIPKSRMAYVKKQYVNIGKMYMGSVSQLHSDMEKIKDKQDIKNANNETIVAKMENALLLKDFEIQRLNHLLDKAGIIP
jgi:hypothetical protein